MKEFLFLEPIVIFILLINVLSASAQTPFTPTKKFTLNGYIKTLQNWQFPDNGKVYSNHLLHNRLNVKWNISTSLTMAGEWRNRMITGDELKQFSNYRQLLKNPNDKWDLSVAWVDQPDMILLSNTERLWLSYKKNKWFVRAGRQRINWSTTTTWNPNDIFNTYNFLDFDYEERPGCDALQTRYIINTSSNIELAAGFLGQTDKIVGGIKYFKQIRSWDFQSIVGVYENRATAGISLAGSISEAGVKGEMQFFDDEKNKVLNLSAETDYLFKKGWYGKVGVLYNSKGITESITDRRALNFTMTPLQQMPTAWNMEITAQKEFSSIIKSGAIIIFSPSSNLLLLIPNCSISLADNLEANILLQQFILKENNWNSVVTNGFIRMKYSF